MNVPGIVQSALDGEEIVTRVSLGGEDELFVTPTRGLVYRAEGLLSDESVETFSHEADRLALSEGRRKTRFVLEYPFEETTEFTVPSNKADEVLHPVLAGVLNGNGITDSGETVIQTYRFSELTVIVTSDRLVKHIGEAVWDNDYEEYRYEDVTGLTFEPGSVATQIVLEVDGRPRRIKAPNDRADDVSERLKRALCAYHDVDSLDELNRKVGIEDVDTESSDPSAAFESGVDPLDTDSSDGDASASVRTSGDVGGDAAGAPEPRERKGERERKQERERERERESTPTQDRIEDELVDAVDDVDGFDVASATTDDTLADRIDALEATVEHQTTLIERQQETIEQLIEELRQGR